MTTAHYPHQALCFVPRVGAPYQRPLRSWLCLVLGMLAVAGYAAGMPEGFRWTPGSASSLALGPLVVEQAPGRLQPWPTPALLLSSTSSPVPKGVPMTSYWVVAGMGVARLGIEDHPLAAAWRVEATAAGARLAHVPMAEVKTPGIHVVQHSDLLPFTCAAGLTDDCTSTDGVLRIHTTFQGSHRVRKVGGGFYGSEGAVEQPVYTGIRILTITHQPTGRSLQLSERLQDTPAYTAPQTAIRYLPSLRRVLLLGVVKDRGMPLGHAVVLPEAGAMSDSVPR